MESEVISMMHVDIFKIQVLFYFKPCFKGWSPKAQNCSSCRPMGFVDLGLLTCAWWIECSSMCHVINDKIHAFFMKFRHNKYFLQQIIVHNLVQLNLDW